MEWFAYGVGLGMPVLFLVLFRPDVMDRMGPNAWAGIRLASTTKSAEHWSAAHHAAWPVVRSVSVAALVLVLGCAVGTVMVGGEGFALLALIGSTMLVAVGSLVGVLPATRAAAEVDGRGNDQGR